ncbi:MAG: nucleotidyltransferase family protein [Chthoniobacterales bacterium]
MEKADSPARRRRRDAGVKIGAVILAAGSSSRLGQPKQLLQYEGRILVRRAAEAAFAAGCDPVAVVVGAEREKVAAALRDLAVLIVPNEDWAHGIGTSIRAGVARLRENDAVLLLVCDQLFLSADLLRRLIDDQQKTQKPIAASAYAGTVGVPSLFTRACFAQLLSLGEEEGAKTLLTSPPNEVAQIDFPLGAIDIDTPGDFRALQDDHGVSP